MDFREDFCIAVCLDVLNPSFFFHQLQRKTLLFIWDQKKNVCMQQLQI